MTAYHPPKDLRHHKYARARARGMTPEQAREAADYGLGWPTAQALEAEPEVRRLIDYYCGADDAG